MPSIRRFLLISLFGAVSVLTISTAFWTYNNVIEEVDELLDGQLVEAGHILRRLVTHDASRSCLARIQQSSTPEDTSAAPDEVPFTTVIDESFPFYHHQYEVQRAFQVWSEDGTLLIKSSTAPEYPLSSHSEGFTNTQIGDNVWRVFTLRVPKYGLRFQVAQLEDIRENLIRTIAITEVYPLLLMYPLLALFIWYSIGHGLSQIQRVTSEVKELHDPKNLSPVDVVNVPNEIVPLVVELNELFERLQCAFAREERFAADAAHEMRTPLAVVKTHAQVATRSKDDAERLAALNRILDGVDRCTHVVKQLSILNNLKPGEPVNDPEDINLNQVASEVIADLIPQALAKDTEVALEAAEEKPLIFGNLTSMRIMMRNLIDNAIRYSGDAGNVRVVIDTLAQEVVFKVIDDGPGIPAELRDRVFERFYRQLGTKVSGSGLGLSIVSQIVELHHAKISLEDGDNGKGACFKVVFDKAGGE